MIQLVRKRKAIAKVDRDVAIVGVAGKGVDVALLPGPYRALGEFEMHAGRGRWPDDLAPADQFGRPGHAEIRP